MRGREFLKLMQDCRLFTDAFTAAEVVDCAPTLQAVSSADSPPMADEVRGGSSGDAARVRIANSAAPAAELR